MRPEPLRLPQRWAIIAMVTATAVIVAYPGGGTIAAITIGTGVLVADDRILD